MRRLGWRVWVGLILGGYLLAILLAILLAHDDGPSFTGAGNPLGNPPGMVDRLVMWDSAETLHAGTRDNVAPITTGTPRLVITGLRTADFPQQGRWTSPEYLTDFPFTELLPSFNAAVPAQTGLRFEARVRERRSGTWSPWLYFGSWGRTATLGKRVTDCWLGRVHVDVLVLRRPADAWQVRMTLFSFDTEAAASPAVRRVAVSYSGVVEDQFERQRLQKPAASPTAWARDLHIPYRTQQDAPKAIRGDICSPTCVSMVLEHSGVNRPTVENAMAIYDSEYEIFGNWARAIQRAGELGLDAWLARFRDWDSVKAQIASGQPIIASIRFRQGEFPSSVLKESDVGHLIVIRGFTATGDVIVNDPAKPEGNGAVYKADELGRAWFGHGGVGYVIRPAKQPRLP